MNIKRILLVSVTVVALLAVATVAAKFFLASTTPVQAIEAPSNPPAVLIQEQDASDYAVQNATDYGGKKDSFSGSKDYMADDSECHHEQAIDWAAED